MGDGAAAEVRAALEDGDAMAAAHEATAARRRIVSAERLERRCAAIPVSTAVREAVSEAAKTLLTPQLAAYLLNPPQPQIAAPTPTPPPSADTVDSAALLADAGK